MRHGRRIGLALLLAWTAMAVVMMTASAFAQGSEGGGPAGKGVDLKPGGYHVMLLDLKQQLKDGDSVPITLVIKGKDGKRETLEIKAPVRPLGAAEPQPKH